MNVGVTSAAEVEAHHYLNSKGMWITYIICVVLLHFLFLLVLPFVSEDLFSVPVIWTLTNVIHDIIMFFIFHYTKGTPWESTDQGRSRELTLWEQIDYGEQYTASKKFLSLMPIVLFFITMCYTKNNTYHFCINIIFLGLVLVPKFPSLHRVRIFNFNRY